MKDFFEDSEMLVEELKFILVKSLFIWIEVYNFSNFSEFVDFCSSF